jgi:hypothetical protein
MQGNPRVHAPSAVSLLISGFGLLTALAAAAGLFVSGLAGMLSRGIDSRQVLSMFSLGWIAGLVAVLLVPVLVSALVRLLGKEPPAFRLPARGIFAPFNLASVWMLLWPVAAVLGELISRSGTLDWLLLPPIQIYVVAAPLWWLLELGRRGLPSGGAQRSWGILGFNLVVTPVVILVLEMLLLAGLALLAAIVLTAQPGGVEAVSALAQQVLNSGGDPAVITRLLQPILAQPAVIYGLLATTAGLIPLVEELLKPLALWGFIGRRLTPAEGFAAGLLCGFAFGLMESLGSVSNPAGSAWLFTVVGRFGTGLLHTLSAGLMGWGLASAWERGRYLKLGAIFLACAGLHGTWNFFSLLMGISQMLPPGGSGLAAAATSAGAVAPYVLIGLTLGMFLTLVLVNRALRRQAAAGLAGAEDAPAFFAALPGRSPAPLPASAPDDGAVAAEEPPAEN